jgi:hydroxymethylbilane synthase
LQGFRIVNRPLILGTRGSALALVQANMVDAALRAALPGLNVEIRIITTSGDRRSEFSDAYATGAGVKGLFTREIEEDLLMGRIDVAVHSCKDLPGHLPEGLKVEAVLPREDTSDVFIGRQDFMQLPAGAVVGTGSVRRRRQLLWLKPDLQVREIRGNVPTRLEKLRASGDMAGIVLARAGLNRLGMDLAGWHIDPLPVLHAIGQGAIALECREDDMEVGPLLAMINHAQTFTCVRAERELLRLLNGDCHLPVGVATVLENDTLSMRAVVFGDEGAPPREGSASGPACAPAEVAALLYQQIQS